MSTADDLPIGAYVYTIGYPGGCFARVIGEGRGKGLSAMYGLLVDIDGVHTRMAFMRIAFVVLDDGRT